MTSTKKKKIPMKNRLYKEGLRYGSILLGCLVMAVAFHIFFVPQRFLVGGLTGLAMIFYYLFGWPPGLLGFLLNIPLFFLGLRLISRKFFVDSLIGTFVFSACLDGLTFLQGKVTVTDPFLSLIAGGVLTGLGYALVYRAGSSTGGVDILGFLIQKYYHISVGTTNFIYNFALMLVGLFFLGLTPILYSMVMFYVIFKATDTFMVGFDFKKSVLVITEQPEQVSRRILEDLHRGVTFLQGEGGYTGEPRKVLLVILKLNQLARLKKILEETDPQAFVTVQDVNEVFGKGFTY